MKRRNFIKGAGIGVGIIGLGTIIPTFIAETFGPDAPEPNDPREPSLWEKDVGLFQDFPKISSDIRADVAIVGSGVTGLSCAIALGELGRGLKICVVDSHRVCSGSSSRNSGHLVSEYHSWESILKSKGAEVAIEWNNFARRGKEAIIDFIRANDIECDLRKEPLIIVGTKSQVETLEDLVRKMRMVKIDAKFHSGKDFQERVGSSFYQAGIELRDNYIMHPAKLMKGLLEKTIKSGISVYANSPVLELKCSDSKAEATILKTPKGVIVAEKVLVATNAYTPRLGGMLSSRLVPIIVAIVATRQMTAKERADSGFLWGNLKEVQTLSRTIGITPDNRVFLRGIFGYRAFNSCVWENPEPGYERLERELRQRIPYANALEITEKWYGAVAMTASSSPIAGAIKGKSLFVCAGYNGVGMVDGFYHGRLIAYKMLSLDHPDLKYLKGPSYAGFIPPEPARSIGAKTFFFFGL